jgi:hypothetical protein
MSQFGLGPRLSDVGAAGVVDKEMSGTDGGGSDADATGLAWPATRLGRRPGRAARPRVKAPRPDALEMKPREEALG